MEIDLARALHRHLEDKLRLLSITVFTVDSADPTEAVRYEGYAAFAYDPFEEHAGMPPATLYEITVVDCWGYRIKMYDSAGQQVIEKWLDHPSLRDPQPPDPDQMAFLDRLLSGQFATTPEKAWEREYGPGY